MGSFQFRIDARLRLSATAVGMALSATQAGAQALSGADVWGTSDYGYLPCATLACSGASGSWGTYTDGGVGFSSASGSFAGGPYATLPVSSSAAFAAGSYLPVLKAFASGAEEVGTHPGFSSNCCYISYGTAMARGVQYFQYLGVSPQNYAITFHVDGSISAGSYGGISGSLSVTNGIPDAFGELPYGSLLAVDNVSFAGNGSWSDNRTLSFTLNPGDGFYLIASLFAQVDPFGNGNSDASHTWTANFTSGNLADLSPVITATLPPTSTVVPEPGTILLVASGLVAVAMARRRRLV